MDRVYDVIYSNIAANIKTKSNCRRHLRYRHRSLRCHHRCQIEEMSTDKCLPEESQTGNPVETKVEEDGRIEPIQQNDLLFFIRETRSEMGTKSPSNKSQ
ncbi:hypothetical protein ACLB2K_004808 [Fragaria x ananassa]